MIDKSSFITRIQAYVIILDKPSESDLYYSVVLAPRFETGILFGSGGF